MELQAENNMIENSLISLSGVDKSYAKVKALDGVSFDLQQGFYALLGSNGAGKSTLFQLLTGLFAPDSGKIVIAGIDISKQLTRALAHIGVVFQQSALDLGLTVQNNLTFHGRLHGLSTKDIKQRSVTELERLGILDSANKACKTLSGGNRRKVELARALLTEPQVLLMDEATVGLDPASRDLLLKYVHQLCSERKICILWATHLIDEAENAEQILILNKGKLLAQGTSQELQHNSHTNNLLDAFLQLSGQKIMKSPEIQKI